MGVTAAGDPVKQTQENRIGKGKAGPGRPKGVPNKTTQAAKEAIAEAAENLGGSARLVEWAKEDPKNESAFWTSIYPKLIPLDANVNMAGQIGMPAITIPVPNAD